MLEFYFIPRRLIDTQALINFILQRNSARLLLHSFCSYGKNKAEEKRKIGQKSTCTTIVEHHVNGEHMFKVRYFIHNTDFIYFFCLRDDTTYISRNKNEQKICFSYGICKQRESLKLNIKREREKGNGKQISIDSVLLLVYLLTYVFHYI